MKMKCLIFSTVLALLSVGCSDKDDTSQDLVKNRMRGLLMRKISKKIWIFRSPKWNVLSVKQKKN